MRELSLGNEGDFRRIYAVITATHRDASRQDWTAKKRKGTSCNVTPVTPLHLSYALFFNIWNYRLNWQSRIRYSEYFIDKETHVQVGRIKIPVFFTTLIMTSFRIVDKNVLPSLRWENSEFFISAWTLLLVLERTLVINDSKLFTVHKDIRWHERIGML